MKKIGSKYTKIQSNIIETENRFQRTLIQESRIVLSFTKNPTFIINRNPL